MPTHTIALNDRDPEHVALTVEEADELAAKGFKFSIYRPTIGEFRLSYPVETRHMPADGTLTFKQPEKREEPRRPEKVEEDIIDLPATAI